MKGNLTRPDLKRFKCPGGAGGGGECLGGGEILKFQIFLFKFTLNLSLSN